MKLPYSIETQLNKAEYATQWYFGKAVCQKLKENYRVFSEQNQVGDVRVFEEMMAFIQAQKTEINIEVIENQIDRVCPDMDEFSGDLWASLALDAYSALSEWALFTKTKKIEAIKTVAYIALQSAEWKALAHENWSQNLPDIRQKLDTHPEVLQEIAFQENLLAHTFESLQEENQFLKEKNVLLEEHIKDLEKTLTLLKEKYGQK